jgi:hypothetical protein
MIRFISINNGTIWKLIRLILQSIHIAKAARGEETFHRLSLLGDHQMNLESIKVPFLARLVVLENNNGLLRQLSTEGLPLLRSSLQQDMHASCQEVDPAEPGSAEVPSVRRAAR